MRQGFTLEWEPCRIMSLVIIRLVLERAKAPQVQQQQTHSYGRQAKQSVTAAGAKCNRKRNKVSPRTGCYIGCFGADT